MRHVGAIARSFAGTVLLFSGIVGLGTSLALLLCSCIGYLPYSDRPGPGWHGSLHWPSWSEFGVYFGFAPLFIYSCLFFGLGMFLLCLVMWLASTPRWVARVIGAPVAAVAAGIAVTGAGWYVALAGVGADAAALLGLLYGLFLFPYFVNARAERLPLWIRISSVSCATGLFLFWVVAPLLPHRPVPTIQYNLVRLTAGDKPIESPPYIGPEIENELSVLNLHGETHGGIGGSADSGQDSPHIDLELIALEPIRSSARLDLPKAGYVVYILKNGTWTAHPFFSERDGRSILIKPGSDPKYDGGQLKLDGAGNLYSFTWYPVIPKGQ